MRGRAGRKEAFRIFHPILMMTSERRDDKFSASKVGAIKLQCVRQGCKFCDFAH